MTAPGIQLDKTQTYPFTTLPGAVAARSIVEKLGSSNFWRLRLVQPD